MKKISVLFFAAIIAFLPFIGSCAQKKPHELTRQQIVQDLNDSYIFGFPLVLMHLYERVMTNPSSDGLTVPLNRFVSTSDYFENEFKGYMLPRADIFYSLSWGELGKEPLVLVMPDSGERYWVFTVFDAWTNPLKVIGKRTSGTHEQKYLITSPFWKGDVPEGMTRIPSPTNMILITGHTQINGLQDGKNNAVPLHKKIKLVPLSEYANKDYTVPERKNDPKVEMKNPLKQIFEMDIDTYFNLLNSLMIDNPPSDEDKAFLEKVKYLKIGPDSEFDITLFNEEISEEIKAIPENVKSRLQNILNSEALINGWKYVKGSKNYLTGYSERALTSFTGFSSLTYADLFSAVTMIDSSGERLSGANSYVLHFNADEIPQVSAFWSLSAYNSDSEFSKNSMNRYAMRSTGKMKFNNDGSLDIYLQTKNPGRDKEQNWLPVPQKNFSLVFNAYWPGKRITENSWKIPKVERHK